MNLLLPLAEGFEEVEAITAANLLRRAGHQVTLASCAGGPTTAARGVTLVPDRNWEEIDPVSFQGIVIPGGQGGTERLQGHLGVLDALRRLNAAGSLIGAICAGPLVLHASGILEGRTVTSFPGVAGELTGTHWRDEPVVCDGKLITSQGPGTAIAFGLALVASLDGRPRAAALAVEIAYRPREISW